MVEAVAVSNTEAIDHSLASWFLKEMAKRLMEQIEAEYPKEAN